MKTKYKTESRKETPWDSLDDLSESQAFLSTHYRNHFETKHPSLKESKEADYFNAIELMQCRHCQSSKIQKYGKTSNGVQRYKCGACGKTFSILTNTLFENHKISISEWIEFLLEIFRMESLNSISWTNKNSNTTTKYWLEKLFLLLKEYQDDIVLKGNIQIDETYYSVESKDIIYKNGKKLRGLSRNKICIAVACDDEKVYMKVEGHGKPSAVKTRLAYIEHIGEGSHLIHDLEKSHSVLVNELNLTSETYDSREIKKLLDKENPLARINRVHYYIQRFLDSHSGFKRDELQDYLNLLAFIMNPPVDRLLKIEILMKKILIDEKRLTYRGLYSKNSVK